MAGPRKSKSTTATKTIATKTTSTAPPAPVGQSKVISEVRAHVDRWRGFALGPAPAPYPEEPPRYEPSADGERSVSVTTQLLLQHWFRHEPHLVGPGRDRLFKYWPHQRRLVETFIYLYEVRGVRTTEELYALAGVDTLGPQRDPWAKLGGQLATGSGKTKMMSLLVAWAYLNALLEPESPLGFGRHAILIAPGLFVRDRLLQDFRPSDGRTDIFFADPVVPPDVETVWDLKVYDPETCPRSLDPAEGALVVTNYHQLLRERGPAPDMADIDPATRQIDLLFKDPEPARLEGVDSPLLTRFARSRGLLILNDEAHHVGDEPAHALFEQRRADHAALQDDGADGEATAMAWIRCIRKLHGRDDAAGRVALQVDLSATLFGEAGASPSAAKGPKSATATEFKPFDLFRHTVVRYDLHEAIPDGIVKKPILERVEVRNASTGETQDTIIQAGAPNAWEKYRNLLMTGIERWKLVRAELEEEGDPRKPLMFILCEKQSEAMEVANFLRFGEPVAGDLGAKKPTGYRDPSTGETLFLFHDASGEPQSTVVEVHIGQKENRSEAEWEKVRNAVNLIDLDQIPDPSERRDASGDVIQIPNPFNVIVSVMMLKEGWDVRNVKVIVPLRACTSRTLTEQTLGRGLRKMQPPELDDEGAATIVNEDLYVIEHPSFRKIIDDIRDIVVDGVPPAGAREYVPVLQNPDESERTEHDVRIVRFDGLTETPTDWRSSLDVAKLGPLPKRIAWLGEIADAEIQTFLKRALEAGEVEGQTFVISGETSYRHFDQVLELAYTLPLLRELRASFRHKNDVKSVVRLFLERKVFALPGGLPLSFGGQMEPEDARIALGNLARAEVIDETKKALLPELRKAIHQERPAGEAQLHERMASQLRSYQALRKNIVQALRRSTFDKAAVANADEERVARLVDRAVDVTGWVYNHRTGVNFSITYDWMGHTSRYFPDFIVRAKFEKVFHNFIIEVKGRFDDRDKAKASRGRWYCELLTQYDKEPWHYLLLNENAPLGREDITWWESKSTTSIAQLFSHLEDQAMFPEPPTSRRSYELTDTVGESEKFDTAVPFYDLAAAAGAFSAAQEPTIITWLRLPRGKRAKDAAVFAARVVGRSMEPRIPDQSVALFRAFPAGTAPSAMGLDGRRVVVELRTDQDPDMGGCYTLKRWRVFEIGESGITEVELRPDNAQYKSFRLRPADGEIRVVAEFLELLT